MLKKIQKLIARNKCKLYETTFIDKDQLISYINEEVGNDSFIFIMTIGPSQKGKSTFGNWISKKKGTKAPFKVGDGSQSVSVGCEIVYAGKIKEILVNTGVNLQLFDNEIVESNLHVFICDTEGIQSTKSDDQLAAFILPLIDVSAKLIYFNEINPDNTKTKFLEMCQKISEIMGSRELREGRSMFDDKLICRVKDWPKLVPLKKHNDNYEEEEDEFDDDDDEENNQPQYAPQYTLDEAIEKCKQGDMARFLRGRGTELQNRVSLPIEFAPGGPGKPGDPFTKPFNEYLLQLLFSSIHPKFIFTKQTFCDKFYLLADEYSKQKKLISAYLHAFDFKEVDLECYVDNICQKILDEFNELKNENRQLTENEYINMKETYIREYNNYLATLQFNNEDKIKKGQVMIELRFDLEKQTALSLFQIRNKLEQQQKEAKNIYEKRINSLSSLSNSIKVIAQGVCDTFFQDFKKSYIKFSAKDEVRVDRNISVSKNNAKSELDKHRFLLQENISEKIDEDIDQIYEYIMHWRLWLPFQKGGSFKNFIARSFHNKGKNTTLKDIDNHPGMKGYFKKEWKDGECCRGIVIEYRNYDKKYENIVKTISQIETDEN